jgi:SAM-dependent methyltransferase
LQSAPFPPTELMARVGPGEGSDPREAFDHEGARLRKLIESSLPEGWSFEGKWVLDFGCGSGRVLRQFLDEAQRAEFWGCDIDGPSIAWLTQNLSPPLHCFQNGYEPPLPLEDGSLDLVWAMSVFTHIENWSPWLLEMHRVLAPDGILIASFLGEGMWAPLVREPYREDEVGMTVLRHWRAEGADVLHSEWWLRAHWGRAFDVLSVEHPPRAADGSVSIAHSYITLRKRPVAVTRAELEWRDPAEPRELAALDTNLRVLRYEMAAQRSYSTLRALVSSRARELAARSPLLGRPLRLLEGLRSPRGSVRQ